MLDNPIIYEPFPPEIVERQAVFFIGRQTGRSLIESRLAHAGIKASPQQIDEIMRKIRSMQESLDKGGTQMTFYQIKKLMRELRKGLTEEDFWRLVEQITRQKPKLPAPP
jgi:isopropylmalate/homocitrate/citramalate synthase